ncbi:hypothetical protein PSEG_01450 [Pseudomonas sp. Nvir]|nr:hypothetical protein PSNVIR_01581 [Pseudomonas sp. Nvir]
MSKSLETGLRSEAMNRRLPYLALWKAQISEARAQAKALKENWRPELAARSYALDQLVDARLLASLKEKPRERITDLNLLEANLEQLEREQEALVQDAFAWEQDGPPGIAEQIRASFNAPPAPTMVEAVQRAANLTRSISTQMAAYTYNLTSPEMSEAAAIYATPTSYKPKSPITKLRLAAFRTAREEKNISAKNVDQQESKLQKLSAFLAETGKPLDFDCVTAWLDSLNVTAKTKAQYINAGTTFWKWAMKYDAQWREDFKGAVNPFDHHELPQARGKAKADAQRVDFSLSDLTKLHSAASAGGHNTLADLILLGTYTGARIEELCQLRAEHVIEVDGILSFDITDSKTVAGIRVVPVHPALTDLVQRLMAESSDDYLVPSTSRNKYGIRSDLHSKAFGRLKTSLGFGKRQVFHSIRKTVVTQLQRAEVSGHLIAELVGHETGTVTFDIYSQGASAAQKLTAISKIPTLPVQ